MHREVEVYMDDILAKKKNKKIMCKSWGNCSRGCRSFN
jgi:hypothetical protein